MVAEVKVPILRLPPVSLQSFVAGAGGGAYASWPGNGPA